MGWDELALVANCARELSTKFSDGMTGEYPGDFFGRGIFHMVGCLDEPSEGDVWKYLGIRSGRKFLGDRILHGRNVQGNCLGSVYSFPAHYKSPCAAVMIFATWVKTHTHTHTYRFLSGCKEVEHCTSQLHTTSQHHSPTRILPRNHTNTRIHAHTTPTKLLPQRLCYVC